MRFVFLLLLSFFLFMLSCTRDRGGDDWQSVATTKEVWQTYPERVRYLIGQLDLAIPELRPMAQLLEQGDTVSAADWLLHYYREVDRRWVIEALDSMPPAEAQITARLLLADSIIIQGVTDRIPLGPDGGWQWDHTGPEHDAEFAYSLNTQAYLPALFREYEDSRSAASAARFDRIVRDWIVHHPLPAPDDSIYLVLQKPSEIDYRDIGEVEWRTLDTGRRLGSAWPQLFYAFQDAEAFRPATRLLMLSSMAEQAAYLRQYHKSGHNWTTMEMNGLALVGLAFPEFRNAESWVNYALGVMQEEINRQVYPDGIQTEVSTKTQWVALNRFETIAVNLKKAGRSIAPAYTRRLEEMYHYLAYAMRPDGHQPLNNDSDREDLRPRVLRAAEKFDRPDWTFIATNGKRGKRPEIGPTVTFPWAGIHIMRNGWDGQAHWAFFDTGPYGTGHQHRDKLHLSVSAFGKDLLVDGGRYTHRDYFSFDPTVWRGYFRSSFSHNVILVDGKGQQAGVLRADSPLESGLDFIHHRDYDYARGSFEEGFEQVEGMIAHRRSVLYLRDRFWVVLDQIDTDRPRELQVLWHFAPDCEVVLDGSEAATVNPNSANLRLVPVGPAAWSPELIKGQETPHIQGWYSADYGKKVPNPTLVYSANTGQSLTFAWILIPVQGEVGKISARMEEASDQVRVSIETPGRDPVLLTLPKDKNLTVLNVKQ